MSLSKRENSLAPIIENNVGRRVSGMVGSRDSRDVTKTPAVPSFSISLCLIFSSVSFHALAKSQKSFSPQCEKDSSVKPMLTAQSSESTQLTSW